MKLFREFRLDTINHCLWRGEERLSLTPKAFDVLRYLVEHADRLVTQDEILEALWPETYVNPEVVKKYVLGIRKVLGDQPDKPVFVATFPRRGYQFIAPFRDESASPSEISKHTTKTVVGRENALAQLDACLNKALQGRRQVVFVTGEAGIGKTTLADLFHQRASFWPNLRLARGQCVEGFAGKEAYYPVLEAIGQLVRETEGSPIVPALIRSAPTWAIQFPAILKGEQRDALQKEILGATRDRMVREICEVLEVISAQTPLILILEDLHWVDPSTLDLVSALGRRRGTAKLLLLGTYRPADAIISQSPLKALKQDLLVHNLCEEIALERLEESDVAEYLSSKFQEAQFPVGLAKLVYRHSGGNALFMVAIVQDMVKSGLIAQLDGNWALTRQLESVIPSVPETLQQLIQLQFEELNKSEQSILKSASVAGERFSVWAVTTALEMEPAAIESVCEGLSERQKFIKAAGIQELANGEFSAHYEFRHSLYREVLYRRLSDVTRSKLHRVIGNRLVEVCVPGKPELAAELAMHFEQGRDYENAVHYIVLAAENAAARFAYRDSIEILEHAHELARKLTTASGADLDVRILEFIGDAHIALGSAYESARAYEEAASRAAQAGLKAAHVGALASLIRPLAFIHPIDPDRGLAALDKAVEVSKASGDPLLIARTQMLASSFRLLYYTWHEEDADLCTSAFARLRSLGDSQIPALHKMFYAQVQVLRGNYQEALDIFDSALPQPDQWTSLMAQFYAVSGKTLALLCVGQFGEALQIVKAGKENAAKNGNDPWLFDLREAWLRILALDFEGARRICEMMLSPKSDSPAARLGKGLARLAAGYAALDNREYEVAMDYFKQACDPDVTSKFFAHRIWRMTAQLGLMDTWLQMGDIAKANHEADVFLKAALGTADPHLQALAWEMKTRVAMAQKDWVAASKYTEQALAIVEKFEVPVAAWQVHATAWELYGQKQDNEAAEAHRKRAEAEILALANSFDSNEPLRKTFLAAAQVRRILDGAVKGKTLRQSGPRSVAM